MAASPSPPTPIAHRLARRGQHQLALWSPALDQADRQGLVSGPARLLCCGLAELAHTRALAAGALEPHAVTHAAAGLALLTKVDDEVIDAPSFHGGPDTDRAALRARTHAFLAPTLDAVHTGRAPSSAPARVHLAARVGRQLRDAAASASTLDALLDLIRRGWHIQVDAVVTLSAQPGTVPLDTLARVTAGISGAWLAMITAVGGLAVDRPLTADEEAAFFSWGLHIQSADALADLPKDLDDRFAATLPLGLAVRAEPELLQSWREHDGTALRQGLVRTGADRQVLPGPSALRSLDARLRDLGDVPELLRWIHGFLLGRYLARTPEAHQPAFAPFVPDWQAFAPTHAPDAAEAPCSAW